VHLAAGQGALHDLRALTSIVAVEGELHLHFREHALAWLGGDAPATVVRLCEGERFVMPQRGAVSIGAPPACAACFVVEACCNDNGLRRCLAHVLRSLATLIEPQPRHTA
jgi:hypothetical protein